MEKKFGIKCVYVAKDNNPNFAGKVLVGVYGKGGYWNNIDEETTIEKAVALFGYNRKSDAVRYMNWLDKNMIELYWDKEYSLVEYTYPM